MHRTLKKKKEKINEKTKKEREKKRKKEKRTHCKSIHWLCATDAGGLFVGRRASSVACQLQAVRRSCGGDMCR